jgi:hypothetical protein
MTDSGEIGDRLEVKLDKNLFKFVNNSSELELNYALSDVTGIWITKVYDRNGQYQSAPTVSMDEKTLEFGKDVFGEVEISGKALGHYYVLTMEIDKKHWVPEGVSEDTGGEQIEDGDVIWSDTTPEEMNSYSYSNLAITITASWLDSKGKTMSFPLELEVPDCVKAILAFCPGEEIMFYLKWCEDSSDRQVYFSTCTGEVLEVRDGVNEKTYCHKMALKRDPGPWLKTLL